MKNKLTILMILIFITMILTILTGFTHSKEEKEIEGMLSKRTDIIQNVLFNKITEEEGYKQLKDIESGSLYRRDCDVFDVYKNTDYDIVSDMKLISLNKESSISDITSYTAEIEWTTITYDGIETFKLDHYIGMKRKGDSYKIVSFEPIEDINLP